MARKNFAATGSFVPEDRPRALDLLGFASQLVFNTFHNRRLRDWEHGRRPRARRRRGAGAQPGHGRVLLGRRPAAAHLLRARSPTSTRPARWPRRPSTMGAAALLVASRLPAGPLAQPRRARPGVGARPGGRAIPIVFHVGGTGDLIDPNYFRNGLPIPPDFHGGEENFRSVDYMGIPGPADADAGDDDLRRRVRALPGPARSASSSRARSGCRRGCARWSRRSRRSPARGAAAGAVAAPERVRPPADPLHALPDRGRRLDHRAGRPRGLPVLLRLPARRGRPPADRAVRALARRRSTTQVRQAFYRDNFVDLMGAGLPVAA